MIALMVFMGVMTQTYAAGNYKDTKFKFSFTAYSPYMGQMTETRAKKDKTSSYMKCEKASHSYDAEVYAVNPKGKMAIEYYVPVNSPVYIMKKGDAKYLVNYVREKGYKNACIRVDGRYAGKYTVSGLWSPDSI